MTDLETRIRAAIALLRRRYRVVADQAADDEAVTAILEAADSGGPFAIAEVIEVPERTAGLEQLAGEILGAFTKGSNGWAARVSQAQIGDWRQRLGQDDSHG